MLQGRLGPSRARSKPRLPKRNPKLPALRQGFGGYDPCDIVDGPGRPIGALVRRSDLGL